MDLSKGSHIKLMLFCDSLTVPHDIFTSRESGYMESSQLVAKELTAG